MKMGIFNMFQIENQAIATIVQKGYRIGLIRHLHTQLGNSPLHFDPSQ